MKVCMEANERVPMRTLSYCVMPNHWHFVLWPLNDGDLSEFVGWLTLTHTQRWHAAHGTVGMGHIYQGRFKSFPVQEDGHFLTVCRYVERNPLRAGLVERAEAWQWSSLSRQGIEGRGLLGPMLTDWPVARPAHRASWVNEPLTEAELNAVRHSIKCGAPYGAGEWATRTAERLGLDITPRPRGRPRKKVSGTFF